jgi:alkane 1-monooxygenase
MTTATFEAAAWKDGKRHAWLMGLLIPSLPLLGWALVAATGLSVFWWTGPIFYFLIIPPLELLIGEDRNNPPDGAVERLENDRYYRYCTFLYLPLQYASLIGSAWLVARGGLSWLDVLGIALTTGLSSGVGINAAHEMGHKKPTLERWLAKIALAPTAYGHFFVEHNRGHHVRVATPEDPASSRLGESFWAFLPRTVIGSARSAWNLEKERLGRSGRSPWTLRNDVLNAWLMSVVLFGGLILWLGPVIIPFLLIQAVYGFMLLEVVNYLEHYGLVRQKQADGRYERCQPQHSWNSNHVVTNLLLYHLQRHSDHHTNPTRRYQALRHFEQSPQLPSGYASMVALAYIPPLWRWVMDRRVLAHY